MRVLVTIMHVYNPGADPLYSSSGPDPLPRVDSLRTCLRSLRANFDSATEVGNLGQKEKARIQARDPIELDIVVCTIGDLHLLDSVSADDAPYRHHSCRTDVDPMMAGFECREVLAEALGSYEYYCYLEDDIILTDPLFFTKLVWFDRLMGAECLLQANRYETGPEGRPPKLYIDGPIPDDATRNHQEIRDRPEVTLYALGSEVRFLRPLNPHSGSYFLNEGQMREWASRRDFLERDISFVGPLESIATLGIMRAFRIYKPAPENAPFLELRHGDSRWWSRMAGELDWPDRAIGLSSAASTEGGS